MTAVGVEGEEIFTRLSAMPKKKSDDDSEFLVKQVQAMVRRHQDLLDHVGAETVPNAKRKIDRERLEFEKTKVQLQEVVNALDVDNWRNAVVRAKSLLNKLEKDSLPKWLHTISPAWVGKIPPSQYKRWLHFCREQFLVALGEFQAEAEMFPDFDLEAELERMKDAYMTLSPGEFIEEISQFVFQDPDTEDSESTENTEDF
jgi:hypothetical protein